MLRKWSIVFQPSNAVTFTHYRFSGTTPLNRNRSKTRLELLNTSLAVNVLRQPSSHHGLTRRWKIVLSMNWFHFAQLSRTVSSINVVRTSSSSTTAFEDNESNAPQTTLFRQRKTALGAWRLIRKATNRTLKCFVTVLLLLENLVAREGNT